ncbi:hypothetical protein [Sphingomonas sanxanigenens]|uniref:Uncharacterized protein n=1 Tax=Sphingomonas sanxanigenens DSM 19645 = NX02 TaxID=1123269 RepID=W0AD28_9SPHN|nr:hypothetical protein [Sphingomonas sanxanigenens]AHE54203.1 hypothetical protein NX02_12525 [Sphingomonas sanxanigenens DSM 19645 = NX02]
MPHTEFASPVDLPPEEGGAGGRQALRWTTVVIVTAATLLALFNATALRGWAQDLPPGPVSERILTAAEGWYGLTDAAGLTAPGKTIRAAYDRVKAARFGGADQEKAEGAAATR